MTIKNEYADVCDDDFGIIVFPGGEIASKIFKDVKEIFKSESMISNTDEQPATEDRDGEEIVGLVASEGGFSVHFENIPYTEFDDTSDESFIGGGIESGSTDGSDKVLKMVRDVIRSYDIPSIRNIINLDACTSIGVTNEYIGLYNDDEEV